MENSIVHTYHVGGMSCGGCATTVQNKLSGTAGVTSVKVDLAMKKVEIASTVLIKAETLQSVLSNTEYTITELICKPLGKKTAKEKGKKRNKIQANLEAKLKKLKKKNNVLKKKLKKAK